MKRKIKQNQEDESVSTGLKEQFEQVKAQPTHRKVKLVFKSCCGCGCLDIELVRNVPFDSKLKDGDRTKDIEDGDEMID